MFDKLHTDVLRLIFSYLNPLDLSRAVRTCTAFNSAVSYSHNGYWNNYSNVIKLPTLTSREKNWLTMRCLRAKVINENITLSMVVNIITDNICLLSWSNNHTNQEMLDKVFQFLVSCYMADTNLAKDKFKISMLDWAALLNQTEAIKQCFENYKNLNNKEMPQQLLSDLLPYAARNGHIQTIRLLYTLGIKFDANDRNSLGYAATNGHLAVVIEILNSGININLLLLDRHSSALHLACEYNHISLVKYLLDNNADINFVKPNHNVTSLFAAAQFNNEIILRLLLSRHANEFIPLKRTKNDLIKFAEGKSIAVQERMKDFLDKSAQEGNQTVEMLPLDIAIVMGNTNVANILKESMDVKINSTIRIQSFIRMRHARVRYGLFKEVSSFLRDGQVTINNITKITDILAAVHANNIVEARGILHSFKHTK